MIVIATPNKDHAPQAKAALELGIATVIDKPVATNAKECEDLIETSKKKNALLSVFQNRRWDNDFLTIKQLIDKGTLGTILRFESRFERYRPAPRAGAWRETVSNEEGGGILFDLGSHLIDQATHLFGQANEVYAEVDVRREGVKSDDDSFVALSFPSGVRAHLWMSAMSASQGHRFRVLGSEGAYEKYGLDPQEDALRAGKTPTDKGWGSEPDTKWGTLTQYIDGFQKQEKLKSQEGCYQNFYEQMKEAIRGNGAVPVNPAEALATLKIIEAARQSAKEKSPLSLACR
ncbi:MAG: Gfo/Idh/MocA family oxidoreductase [Candidatus Obscuribacterales bacterium]|nr:Gfo/Idh/MocA family oxidoreductase [Candidatus Obscuribacterales bacterium]